MLRDDSQHQTWVHCEMSKKLNNLSTALKCYWSILNWFLNNKMMPSIFPIIHNSKVILDFKEESNLFRFSFWSSIYICVWLISYLNTLLNSCSTTETDIFPIKLIDPNKSHGWDNISIKMIQKMEKWQYCTCMEFLVITLNLLQIT